MPTNSLEPLTKQTVYKVSEVTRRIRQLLEAEFPSLWIEGEVSNFKRHTSGHIYFTLKDAAAQINAVFFARENQSLRFELKDGLQVICMGRISVFDQRGQYQLYVNRVEPKGLGALQLAFLQLKEKLEKEGLFEAARKKPIPAYPKRIGIVTSPTGAAIQDMLKIFRKRSFGLHVFLYPVRVQGEGAGREISEAIDRLNQMGSFDLLIVGRGGGSLEDLWAFNEEEVARAIARSEIPVISAVGHEIDWTISDFVADFRAHTPTAAAEKVLMHWDELASRLREHRQRMQIAVQNLLTAKREQLAHLKEAYAFRQPLSYVRQMAQRVDELLRQMQNYLKGIIVHKRQVFESFAGKLDALSPLAILRRGYSITFDAHGVVLRETSRLNIGDLIRTRMSSGTVESKITKVKAGDGNGTGT